MTENLRKIYQILKDHERRLAALEGKKITKGKTGAVVWYKSGSTIEKIIMLLEEGYFNEPKSISEIISELEKKDYHFESSDLTLPIRKIVRKGLLKKTRERSDGTLSKNWLYVKA